MSVSKFNYVIYSLLNINDILYIYFYSIIYLNIIFKKYLYFFISNNFFYILYYCNKFIYNNVINRFKDKLYL